MEIGHTLNIIRIYLLFFILLTGVLSIIINERKKKILAKRTQYDRIIASLEHPSVRNRKQMQADALRSKEINAIATIIALKGGIRSLAIVLGILCLLFVLIEVYRFVLH